jgi:hypothetical protein
MIDEVSCAAAPRRIAVTAGEIFPILPDPRCSRWAAARPKVAERDKDAGAYDGRYGPGHRPHVITKAVGNRGGVSTWGGLGPE